MSTTIYDASQITKLRANRTQSGDFLNRVNAANPNTGYGPRLGIYDQSVINTVKDGNMKHYRKGDGGVVQVVNGCPCAPLTGDEAIYGTN
jgi:hypothetical protein